MENEQVLLTQSQRELLEHLRQRDRAGLPPAALDQLCAELGLRSRGSLHKQISALIEAGLVAPMERKQRGVRLTRSAWPDAPQAPSGLEIPILGRIAAGQPIEALGAEDRVAVPREWQRAAALYALRVRGDSMLDMGIADGDLVVVEARQQARRGEVVVALIDGQDATLKRYEPAGSEILLHPENAAHAVQRYHASRVTVQGVLVGLLREYR